MKKLFTFFSVSLITLLLVSCGGGKDYRNMIPSDAFIVMSAKPKTIAHKAQVGDFTQNLVYHQLESMINEKEDLTPEAREYILSLIAEPSKSGLSMDHDVFFFMTGNELMYGRPEVVGLFKVKERRTVDSFTDFIVEQTKMKKIEEDGITFLRYDFSYTTELIAYNDDAFMVLSSPDTYDKSMPAIKQLFAQKKEESIMNRPQVASILDGNNDMNMIMSYSSLMPMIKQMAIPDTIDFIGKMSIAMPVNFEKGAIVSDTKIFFDDEEAEKQYLEYAAISPKSTGEFVKYLPEGSIAAFGGGLNGAKTYEMLTQIPMYSMIAMIPQVQTVMDAIEGDMLLSFNTMSSDGRYPLATVMAKVNDENIATTISYLTAMTGFQLNETSPGHFSGNVMGVQVWMGCKDNMFYLSSDNGFLELLSNGEGASMNDKYGHLFNDTYGAFVVDITALCDLLESLANNEVISYGTKMVLPFIRIFDDFQLSGKSAMEVKVVTNMTDKDRNSAEVLYQTINKAISMLIGMGHGECC